MCVRASVCVSSLSTSPALAVHLRDVMGVKVCVVGGGVVGLTTATLLQEEAALPAGSSITLLADKFLRETTSDGVAGLFLPSSDFRGPTDAVTK